VTRSNQNHEKAIPKNANPHYDQESAIVAISIPFDSSRNSFDVFSPANEWSSISTVGTAKESREKRLAGSGRSWWQGL
jgi:hypothetical protein